MSKEQIFNPYLPLYEYVPDGEPHVFDGRIYIYGSHDEPGGTVYCAGHYVTWSAPVDDLTNWRYEGVIYRRSQDPSNADDKMQLWAPDVTRGPDGRYYLYYCFSGYPEIGVAVSDSPAGPFEFYGHVKYPTHIMGGKTLREHMPFDPAVLTDDDGRVYLYYGFAPACEKEMRLPDFTEEEIAAMPPEYQEQIRKVKETKYGENGMAVELEADMITMKAQPKPCIPGGHHTAGTGFEGHGFFEASSIRKIHSKYYFVYSSHKSHELCYAVSDRPLDGYVYGGTLVSNGNIGYQGNTKPVCPLGNNHGGILQIGEEFYIFYHRQTNGTEFSRQGCAEKLQMLPDGSFPQAEITSYGLNGGPLKASGTYPAAIACHLTDPTTQEIINYIDPVMQTQVRITQRQNTVFITDIKDKAVIGYKYFDCKNVTSVALELRGSFRGQVAVSTDADGTNAVSKTDLAVASDEWGMTAVGAPLPDGVNSLYFSFRGEGSLDMKSFAFFTGSCC